MPSPVIVVHGGAGLHDTQATIKKVYDLKVEGVRSSALAGYRCLVEGGSALDAVEQVVRVMEDDPSFNAGKGSNYTTDGEIEMDACIMDGRTLQAGAVACIKNVSHPVSVARLVMQSNHVLLVGEGALKFAQSKGVPFVPTEDLKTERATKRFKDARNFEMYQVVELSETTKPDAAATEGNHDTVGAVALDANGDVAFATSTGGKNAKLPGRAGDCVSIGAGGYSDNLTGAVTCTGDGEAFMKTCFSKEACNLLNKGYTPTEALKKCLSDMQSQVSGGGGAIAVNMEGEVGIYFTTQGMSWTYIKDNTVHYGIFEGENFTKPL